MFTLIITTRKLWPYFQEHPIKVLTEAPLRKILQRLNASGHLTNWAMELSKFEIEYAPCTFLKGQVLVDFIVEFTGFASEEGHAPPMKPCQVFVNGSSYLAGGGVGVHNITNKGKEHDYTIKLAFKTTKTRQNTRCSSLA